MAQKTGALIFDEQTDRYDIRFDIADYYGGLHCGECMDVFTGGKWKENAFDMEKHLRRRPVIVKPDEVFDYYEVDEADLQEDTE